ncbi:MAG: type II toxin-antitoxin system HicA family toxin [Deltaproteobacteria bacterium]|nr:type II toxin-antitoxin system HicA family toxin [Deltaproteobacteria bacterium]
MKRIELLKYLRKHGCEIIREGHRHSWWGNASLNKRSSVPRHTEIDDGLGLVRKICKDLGIEPIK